MPASSQGLGEMHGHTHTQELYCTLHTWIHLPTAAAACPMWMDMQRCPATACPTSARLTSTKKIIKILPQRLDSVRAP